MFFCDEDEPACLDFHHAEANKESHIADMLRQHGVGRLLREISKCVVVCANCHRKIHAGVVGLSREDLGRAAEMLSEAIERMDKEISELERTSRKGE